MLLSERRSDAFCSRLHLDLDWKSRCDQKKTATWWPQAGGQITACAQGNLLLSYFLSSPNFPTNGIACRRQEGRQTWDQPCSEAAFHPIPALLWGNFQVPADRHTGPGIGFHLLDGKRFGWVRDGQLAFCIRLLIWLYDLTGRQFVWLLLYCVVESVWRLTGRLLTLVKKNPHRCSSYILRAAALAGRRCSRFTRLM